jgi:hypothetical protein
VTRFWGALAVIAIAALFRLLPHPPNFSPIAAMALFGGAYFARKSAAIALPLIALFITDLALGFHETMPAVYGSFVLVAVLGFALQERVSAVRVGVASAAGSLIFFAITNFSVWAQGGLYEKSVSGLLTCYIAALPFLQNSFAGDMFFSAVLFGGWALAERRLPQLRAA